MVSREFMMPDSPLQSAYTQPLHCRCLIFVPYSWFGGQLGCVEENQNLPDVLKCLEGQQKCRKALAPRIHRIYARVFWYFTYACITTSFAERHAAKFMNGEISQIHNLDWFFACFPHRYPLWKDPAAILAIEELPHCHKVHLGNRRRFTICKDLGHRREG